MHCRHLWRRTGSACACHANGETQSRRKQLCCHTLGLKSVDTETGVLS